MYCMPEVMPSKRLMDFVPFDKVMEVSDLLEKCNSPEPLSASDLKKLIALSEFAKKNKLSVPSIIPRRIVEELTRIEDILNEQQLKYRDELRDILNAKSSKKVPIPARAIPISGLEQSQIDTGPHATLKTDPTQKAMGSIETQK